MRRGSGKLRLRTKRENMLANLTPLRCAATGPVKDPASAFSHDRDPELPWCDHATAVWQRLIDVAWVRRRGIAYSGRGLRHCYWRLTPHKQSARFDRT